MWSFTFKGESSRDFGITVNRRAPRQSANVRTLLTEIDGRDGAFIEKVGYNTYTMNMEITVQGQDNLHKITSWLKGEGKFTRSDIPERYLLVKHESEIEFIMISKELYSAQLTFQVMYPKWLKEDNWSEPWGANLIPNGWDSFRPYGSGKMLFDSNFEEHWSKDGKAGGTHDKGVITTTDDGYYGMWKKMEFETPSFVTVELKSSVKGHITVKYGAATLEPHQKVGIINDGEFHTYSFELGNTGNGNLILGVFSKGTYEFRNLKVSNIEDKHLVVEKTPLENGLTRIQTWGGSNNMKLRMRARILTDKDTVFSTHFRELKQSLVVSNNTGTQEYVRESGFFNMISENGTANTRMQISILPPNDSLDFIASTPTIVEGDTPPTWEADENPRIINEGNTTSQPIIRLIKGKEDKLDIVINGIRFIYEFDNSPYVDIDCYTQEVIDSNGLNKSRYLKIGYLFPELKPGANVVEIKEGDATVLFRRKDAWK